MNLLEMLNSQLGNQLSKQAGAFLGESESNVSSALGGIFPSLLGKVADMAQTSSGAESIFKMANGADDSILDNISGLFGGGADSVNSLMGSGSGMVNALFGGGLGSIIDKVSGMSGLKKSSSSSLIKLAAPFLMGFVKRQIMSKGLNAVGLGSMLGEQKGFIEKLLPAGFGSLLGLSGLAGAAKNVVGGTVDAAKNVASGTANVVGNVASGAANVAGNVADTTVKTGGSILKWLLPVLAVLALLGFFGMRTGCSAVDNAASKVADTTSNVATGAADLARDGAGAVVDGAGAVVEGAGNVLDAAGSAVMGAFSNVNEAAAKVLSTIKFEAGSAGEKMKTFIDGGFKGDANFRIKNGNFATGSDALVAETKAELDQLTAILNAYPDVKLGVHGYTDNAGDAGKNQMLSEARAKSVKAYLIGKGIAGDRISVNGFGAANPVASNDTEAGRAENRRIELVVVQ